MNTAHAATSHRPLRVRYLSRVRMNPYVHLLARGVRAADPSIATEEAATQTWRSLILRRPHILHLHWVELQYGQGASSENVAARRLQNILRQLRMAQRLGVRVVYTVHNLNQHEGRYPDLNARANDWLFAHADAIHVHARATADEIARQYGRKTRVFVIPHGNYADAYPMSDVTRAGARERLGLPADHFIYLYFGQIRPYKGVEQLLSAFRVLADPHATLVISGHLHDPDAEQTLRDLIADQPTIRLFPSFIPDHEIELFFKAADVGVLPYRQATTSGAALLAFTFGLPLVAPAIGPFPELVGGERGILFDPTHGDLAGALAAARSLDLSRARAAALSLAAQYNWHDIGARHAAVYRTLAP